MGEVLEFKDCFLEFGDKVFSRLVSRGVKVKGGIIDIVVCGSTAHGTASQDSDIDVFYFTSHIQWCSATDKVRAVKSFENRGFSVQAVCRKLMAELVVQHKVDRFVDFTIGHHFNLYTYKWANIFGVSLKDGAEIKTNNFCRERMIRLGAEDESRADETVS